MSDGQVKPRFLVDISHTYRSSSTTGIQRVVRKLAELIPEVAASGELDCRLVICKKGKFWSPLGSDVPLCNAHSSRQLFLSRWPFPRNSDRVDLNSGLARTSFQAYWNWKKFVSKLRFSVPVELSSNDILLLPDGYWAAEEVWAPVSAAKDRGAMIVSVLYDLICLTHPHYHTARTRDAFTRYLDTVRQNADLVMTISEAVKEELERLAAKSSWDIDSLQLSSFRLGADRMEQSSGSRGICPRLKSVLRAAPYLMVATLEPRKNHHFVLDAFDALWRNQSVNDQLLLVGKVGWGCKALMDRIENHQQLNRKLHVFHDLDDHEVAYCYNKSKAVITASEAEGFGLPIAEGLRYAKTVFASDIAVHREVGRSACNYFSLEDSSSLANALDGFEAGQIPGNNDAQQVDSWRNSATDLVRQVLEAWAVRTCGRVEQDTSCKAAA